jgi:hypothetical protein
VHVQNIIKITSSNMVTTILSIVDSMNNLCIDEIPTEFALQTFSLKRYAADGSSHKADELMIHAWRRFWFFERATALLGFYRIYHTVSDSRFVPVVESHAATETPFQCYKKKRTSFNTQ